MTSLLKRFQEQLVTATGQLRRVPPHEFTDFLRTALTELKEEMEAEKGPHKECYWDRCEACEATHGFNAGLDKGIAIINRALEE